MDRIRIGILDDYPAFARGLELVLSETADIEVVGTASRAEDAEQLVERWAPHIVLMDVRLPTGREGIEATKRICARFPETKVLMLSASEEGLDVREALDAGASGYLIKRADVDELLSAIRTVSAGEVVISPAALRVLLDHADDVQLDDAERELLALVAEGLDVAEIARRMSVSESTLKRRFQAVVDKLPVDNRIEAAVYAALHGWI